MEGYEGMRPVFKVLTIAATIATLMTPVTNVSASGPKNAVDPNSAIAKSPLTVSRTDKHGNIHYAHVMPTYQKFKANQANCPATCADPGPLNFHAGAPIMQDSKVYAIFWNPPTLQSGTATTMPTFYKNFIKQFHYTMISHGLYNIATQYYQTVSSVTSYIQNVGSVQAFYEDTHAYPASGCSDTYLAHPTDCITDAQIQAEITRVMGVNGWTGAPDKIFFLYTSSNEGSCFTNANTSCAYNQYCAYHSAYGAGPTIYANQPYGDPNVCLGSGTNPYNSQVVAAVLTGASHEWSEAMTDPQLNAWYTTAGNENGDLCAYNYGTNTWDGGLANQMWNGHFFELQTEYSNHAHTVSPGNECLLVGP